MRGSIPGWLRALAALPLVAVVALPTAGDVDADPGAGATDVITVAAVGANGEPANGYWVADRLTTSVSLSGCSGPSPAAVGNNIYSCDPSEAGANICWPAPASLLCVRDPWSRALRRFVSPGALAAVDPPQTPMPFALVLDDGTRCVLRAGEEWGGRADGLVPAYGCGMANWSYAVLASPDQDLAGAIDRSQPLWRVQTGQVGPPTAGFWPPLPRKVATAWFAGNAGD
jgi:hypothetical protein